VRLSYDGVRAAGHASAPAVDSHVLRAAAVATTDAVDGLLAGRGRCVIEHVALVSAGTCEVAVVVLLLVAAGWVEQLSGSAVAAGDPRQAVVRATLAALNRRLEGVLGG